MSKRFFALALALLMLFLVGCQPSGDGGNSEMNGTENGGQQNRGDEFVLKATVNAVYDDYIEVEIVDSDYAFGVYWVRTGVQTVYLNNNGGIVSRSDVKAGQTLNIVYSGQTMMSLPPQIVAWSITIL